MKQAAHRMRTKIRKLIDVTEEYTSKTCTRCGQVHPKLGGSQLFHCPECGL
ncbi:zinc ribbon domain-containing protein, partial [Aerosakkonema funiforme]|uniref:zinc ribbon domain-containing protein n=1 Tax=Aerosakkonema funiforme TaxID=1246630 RepID=UPI002AC84FF4